MSLKHRRFPGKSMTGIYGPMEDHKGIGWDAKLLPGNSENYK